MKSSTKKWILYGGVAGGAFLLYQMYQKKQQAAAQAAQAAAQAAARPAPIILAPGFQGMGYMGATAAALRAQAAAKKQADKDAAAQAKKSADTTAAQAKKAALVQSNLARKAAQGAANAARHQNPKMSGLGCTGCMGQSEEFVVAEFPDSFQQTVSDELA